jgi:hypothetical protein
MSSVESVAVVHSKLEILLKLLLGASGVNNCPAGCILNSYMKPADRSADPLQLMMYKLQLHLQA